MWKEAALAAWITFSLCRHIDAALRLNGAESEVAAPLQTEELQVTLEDKVSERKSVRIASTLEVTTHSA
jgi:hypothetical protein